MSWWGGSVAGRIGVPFSYRGRRIPWCGCLLLLLAFLEIGKDGTLLSLNFLELCTEDSVKNCFNVTYWRVFLSIGHSDFQLV